MDEHVDDLDVQRVIHAMTHRIKDEYFAVVSLQKSAESVSAQEVQAGYSTVEWRFSGLGLGRC